MKKATAFTALGILFLGAVPVGGAEDPGGRENLLGLAHRFEERAYRVLDEAASEQRYFHRGQDAGLRAMQELAWVASYFTDQVAHQPNPYRTTGDFEILSEAFFRAEWWMNRVPMDRDVRKEFRKLENTFGQLGGHYAPSRGRYERAGRHRMDDRRYHDVIETRVIPRVQRYPDHRGNRARVYFDIGLRIPGGRVRVVWR